jgi:hypothetical protein
LVTRWLPELSDESGDGDDDGAAMVLDAGGDVVLRSGGNSTGLRCGSDANTRQRRNGGDVAIVLFQCRRR